MKFTHSNDNKRYHTANYYLKQNFQAKVFRVPIDAGFTCPNRDHHLGVMGCSFCSIAGSGDLILRENLNAQIEDGFLTMRRKWPDGLAQLYFQAYTNTYDTLANLKKVYEPFRFDERFVSIIIATRADCLDAEKIAYLAQYNLDKEVWIELGLQSVHEETSRYVNRGHDSKIVFDIMKMCQQAGLKVTLHLINGLPFESEAMMLESAKQVAKAHPNGLKIHMFHILKNTLEAYRYRKQPYPLLTRDEFVNITVQQIRYLPPDVVLFRLTGDGVESALIAPEWTKKKTIVLNEIDKLMAKNDWIQGDLYHEIVQQR